MATPVPFDNFLFDLAGQLTGGFVTDAKTLLAAMVVLGFILMGLDILYEALAGVIQRGHLSQAGNYLSLRDRSSEGSLNYDYYNSLYRKKIASSVSLSSTTGKSFAKDEGMTSMDGISSESSVSSSGDFSSYDVDDPGPSDDDRHGWS